jgi:Arc/MetJ family transcription regulator
MRTNILIDDKLMAETLQLTGLKSKRQVVELGLRTLLQIKKQEKIRQLRGKLVWDGDLDAMRILQRLDRLFSRHVDVADRDEHLA